MLIYAACWPFGDAFQMRFLMRALLWHAWALSICRCVWGAFGIVFAGAGARTKFGCVVGVFVMVIAIPSRIANHTVTCIVL